MAFLSFPNYMKQTTVGAVRGSFNCLLNWCAVSPYQGLWHTAVMTQRFWQYVSSSSKTWFLLLSIITGTVSLVYQSTTNIKISPAQMWPTCCWRIWLSGLTMRSRWLPTMEQVWVHSATRSLSGPCKEVRGLMIDLETFHCDSIIYHAKGQQKDSIILISTYS